MSNDTYQFSVSDAEKFGSADIAAILHNLRFWLRKNLANKTNIHDDRVWTYNTFEAWSVLFPWLSVPQIKRLLKKLEEAGLLIKGNHNKDKFNKTVWYSLEEPEFFIKQPEAHEPPIVRNRTIDNSISSVESTKSYYVTDNKQQIINSKLVNSKRADIFYDRVMTELLADNLPASEKRYASLKIKEYQERWPESELVADCWSYVVKGINHKLSLIGG